MNTGLQSLLIILAGIGLAGILLGVLQDLIPSAQRETVLSLLALGLMITTLPIVATNACIAVVLEHERQTWDTLLSTVVSTQSILTAKLIGSIYMARLLFVITAVFFLFLVAFSISLGTVLLIFFDLVAYAWFTAGFGTLQGTRKKTIIQALVSTFLPLTVYFGSPWFARILLPSGQVIDMLIMIYSLVGTSQIVVWGMGVFAMVAITIYKFVPRLRWILYLLKMLGVATGWFLLMVMVMSGFAFVMGARSDMFEMMRIVSPLALPFDAIRDDIYFANHPLSLLF
jgi:hypothetical protein